MVKIIIGVVVVALATVIHEVGEYAEDVNPFNRYDIGDDFDGEE